MGETTLDRIQDDIRSMQKDLKKLVSYFEEDELELSEAAKKDITESRKRPISKMASHGEVEREFL